jgi:hypothetical protein
MSNAEHEPTHLPKPETIRYIGYSIGLQFHPPLKLAQPAGWEFVKSVAALIDPREAKITDSIWEISQPLGDGGDFRITVVGEAIHVVATNPSTPLEWFETRVPLILEEFHSRFHPKLLLQSGATTAAILDVDGDSRQFLARDVMKMDQCRLSPFSRPIQLVGLRLAMPPYHLKQQPTAKGKKAKSKIVSSAEWGVEVKGESYGMDPSKLFLEVSGSWPLGTQWDNPATQAAVGRLNTVKEFLKAKLLPFLTSIPEN